MGIKVEALGGLEQSGLGVRWNSCLGLLGGCGFSLGSRSGAAKEERPRTSALGTRFCIDP